MGIRKTPFTHKVRVDGKEHTTAVLIVSSSQWSLVIICSEISYVL